MAAVRYSDAAVLDLEEILYFIGRQRQHPVAARKLLQKIRDKCERMALRPLTGTNRADLGIGIRVFPISSYVVVYVPLDDGIDVLRVFHGSRDFPTLFTPVDLPDTEDPNS